MSNRTKKPVIRPYRQSRFSVYSLLGNENKETAFIPINQNTLIFTDKQIELQYSRELYLDSSQRSLSQEFKTVLTYFYTSMTIILLSLGAFTITQYTQNIYSKPELIIHLTIIIAFFLLFFLTLFVILKKFEFLLINKVLYTSFALLLNTYLILFDSKILSNFLSSASYSPLSSLSYSLTFILLTMLYRNILLDDFAHYLVVTIHAAFLYLSLNLSLSPLSIQSKLYDITLILTFLIYNLIETHINSINSRSVFWNNFTQEKTNLQLSNIPQNSKDFETEAEHLIYLCERIQSDIKHAIKSIIYKDIKSQLKDSLQSLHQIKKLIGHGNISIPQNISKQVDDKEDREFIEQNYQDVSLSSHGDFHRSSTIVNFLEHKNFGVFHDYGIKELSSVLEGIGKNWTFDIWFVKETTGRSISIVGCYLISKLGLDKRFRIEEAVLEKYLNSIEFHYKDCPYHNACHGADVLHSLMYFYINSDIQKHLNPIETLAAIIAGLAHDVSHPGVTSRYLVSTRDPLALQYNDISVLENMHCASIYSLMNKPNSNILQNLNNDDWICFRRIVIEMVLSTDMGKHFEILGKFRTRATILIDLRFDKFEDKLLIMSTGLKAADIGHSAKYNNLHQKWTKFVMEEFFLQGDLEKAKKIPISMYCDRENTNICKSQAGFLKNICLPLYEVWIKFLDSENATRTLMELKKNIDYWDSEYKARRSTQPVNQGYLENLNPSHSIGGSHS